MESILTSIKKYLGITEADTSFDPDIIMQINSAFSTLEQLGVGPVDGFFITDDKTSWEEFSGNSSLLGLVKNYIFLKVRSLFDPPSSSLVKDVIQEAIKELEWRLYIGVEFNLYDRDVGVTIDA